MKMLTFSLVLSYAIVTSPQAAQISSTSNGRQPGPALPPGISYSTPFQWQTKTANPATLNRLLTELRQDLEAAAPALAVLNETTENAPPRTPPVPADSPLAEYSIGNSVLLAKDLSTLVSGNSSANLGQNLATSLAMPTSVPWSTWGNGGGMVLVNSNGTVMAIPTFPPRTAWGNGGLVVTTPGGAVFSIVPGPAPVVDAKADAIRQAVRQLSNVQDDLNRVLRYLETISTTNAVPASPPAPSPVDLSRATPGEPSPSQSMRSLHLQARR